MRLENRLPNTLMTFCPPRMSARVPIKYKQNPMLCIRQQRVVTKMLPSLIRIIHEYFSLSKLFFCGVLKKSLMGGLLIGLSVLLPIAHAHDRGTRGNCFSIIEEDFQSFIIRRLSEKDIQKKIQSDFQTQLTHALIPIASLPRATKNRVYWIDPSVETKQKGLINPFEKVTYTKTLVFVDANDESQLQWVKKFMPEQENTKLILVGGNVLETQQYLNRRVFVDQHSELTDYFKITHVPAMVKEDIQKKQWQVKEINLY